MGKKKEIGMEKLIELLNEYAKVLRIGDYVGWHNKETVENSDYIFTKKFGFIGWLVENDKIKIPHELDELPQIYGVDYNSNECKSDRLIMLLSISDTPIEDLISYLK